MNPLHTKLYRKSLTLGNRKKQKQIGYSFAQSTMFASVRKLIAEIDATYNSMSPEKQRNVECLLRSEYQYHDFAVHDTSINMFLQQVHDIAQHICFGVLENGTMLFLYKEHHHTTHDRHRGFVAAGGFKIFWAEDRSSWRIEDAECNYYFELPPSLMQAWDGRVAGWEREYDLKRRTLDFKYSYFPKIMLYHSRQGQTSIKILEISKSFLKDAVNRLQQQMEIDEYANHEE